MTSTMTMTTARERPSLHFYRLKVIWSFSYTTRFHG